MIEKQRSPFHIDHILDHSIHCEDCQANASFVFMKLQKYTLSGLSIILVSLFF